MEIKVFTDGGARGNPGPAAIGVVIFDQNQTLLHQYAQYIDRQTNNVAEYMALDYAVEWISRFCSTTQVLKVSFYLDSMLVVQQVNGVWKIKEPHLQTLCAKIRQSLSLLSVDWKLEHIPRAKNANADKLVNQALDSQSETLSPIS